MRAFTGKLLQTILGSVLWTAIVRGLILLVLASSVGLAWFGLDRVLALERSLRDKDSEGAALANDIQQLEKFFDGDEAKRTEARFKEAESRLFAGQEERDGWRKSIKDRGTALAFQTSVQVGEARAPATAQPDLTLQQATVILQPLPASRSGLSSNERLLGFLKTMLSGSRRVDMVGLSVAGGPNSVRSAKLMLELWSLEPR